MPKTNPPAKSAPKSEFAEILKSSVNVPAKTDPGWDNARLYYRAVKTTGRQFLVAQICLGWELSNKKKELGFTHGGNRKSSGQLGHLIGRTWEQYLESELGTELPRRTADRLIMVYEGFCEKCPKKLRVTFQAGGKRSLITTLSKPPGSLNAKDRQTIETAIAKASDGETQRSLLEELNLVKAHKPLTGGDTSKHKKEKPTDDELMGQLSLKFVQPLAKALQTFRIDSDRDAYLATLSIHSSEPDEITLTTLETALEASLKSVREMKNNKLKTAKGQVINP